MIWPPATAAPSGVTRVQTPDDGRLASVKLTSTEVGPTVAAVSACRESVVPEKLTVVADAAVVPPRPPQAARSSAASATADARTVATRTFDISAPRREFF